MLRKFILPLFLFVGVLATGLGTKVRAQAVEQGDFIIDGYYGFPNLMTGILRTIAVNTNTDLFDLKVTSLGPFGGRLSYMATENIGVGLDVYYAKSAFEYSDTLISGNGTRYYYRLSNPRPRFLARVDYHFNIADKVDMYAGAGIGYSGSRYILDTNDPNFIIDRYSTRTLVPVAYRLAFGTKFYFVKFLGAGVEIAMGGPLVTVGLSGKF
ncbi:MAG: outer membrane beta-barrel protein [Bacteroidia bacterium]